MKRILYLLTTRLTLLGAAAISLSCSGEGLVHEEFVDTTSEALAYTPLSSSTPGINTYGYKWSSGNAPVRMTVKASSTCFLSTVGGHFTGSSSRVEIVPMVDAGVEYWYLTGSGISTTASAFCALSTPVVPGTEKFTDTGATVELMGSTTGHTCMLTGVWGNIGEFSETAESIAAQTIGGKWLLSGFSAGGAAKCIAKSATSATNLPNGGATTAVTLPESANNSSTGPTLCALFRVSGKLRGGFVQAFNRKLTVPGWDWAARTGANPSGGTPSGSAGCTK